MTTYIQFGMWGSRASRTIPVETLEELREVIRREEIEDTPKLQTIWGRKWADYLGRIGDIRVYLSKEGYQGDITSRPD